MARAILDIIEYKENNKKLKSFLEFLNENQKRQLILDIEKYFSKRKINIFQKNQINDDDILFIFKIVNKHLFNNKLKKIDIVVDNTKNIIQIVKDCYKKYNLTFTGFNTEFVAFCNGIITNSDEELNNIEDTSLINIADIKIFINKDYISKCLTIEVVDYIAHEMIHYYDYLYGTFKQDYLNAYLTNNDIESHKTLTFNIYRNKANKFGLNITDIVKIRESKVVIDKNNPLVEYHDGLIVIKSKYKNARAIICID